MGNLLTLTYWFNLNPGPWLEQSLRIVYAVFGLLIILGLIAWLFAGKNKENRLIYKLWHKIQLACLTVGIIGLILIAARQQRIYFLGMPFLLILLLIGALVWAYFIFRYATKVMPNQKEEEVKKKEKEKYLP
jgi:ABC-type transport system involved in multi-copper enzyme maturation permease subunit